MERPRGITILSIACIVAGVLLIIGGVSIYILVSKISESAATNITANVTGGGNATIIGKINIKEANATRTVADTLKFLASIYGALLVIPGALLIVAGVGFWKRYRWSWWLGLAIGVIMIISRLNTTTAFVVLAGVAMIYYLTRPHIKEYFGMR
jgi:lysylphosphatidylglycerol synthetase-like protein (DUF2156 family)